VSASHRSLRARVDSIPALFLSRSERPLDSPRFGLGFCPGHGRCASAVRRVGHRRGIGRPPGSRCCRPVPGITPVPHSVPRPVSCVPHYHPGRRDFPGPVGSESLSSCGLPMPADRFKRWRAYAGLGLVCCTTRPVRDVRRNPGSVSRRRSVIEPLSPRAPSLWRRYPPSPLLWAHARIPSPLASVSGFCLYRKRPRRLRHPRLVGGTVPILLCLSVLECCAPYAGGLPSALDQFFLGGQRPSPIPCGLGFRPR
jgi:hypothetical protein